MRTSLTHHGRPCLLRLRVPLPPRRVAAAAARSLRGRAYKTNSFIHSSADAQVFTLQYSFFIHLFTHLFIREHSRRQDRNIFLALLRLASSEPLEFSSKLCEWINIVDCIAPTPFDYHDRISPTERVNRRTNQRPCWSSSSAALLPPSSPGPPLAAPRAHAGTATADGSAGPAEAT